MGRAEPFRPYPGTCRLGPYELLMGQTLAQLTECWEEQEGFSLTELNPSEATGGGGGSGGDMQFLRGGGGGGGGGGGMAWEVLRRHFSRKRADTQVRINPKVPKEEAVAISGRLLQILADHGPLTIGNTWNHAKDASIDGLNSKTHMKILLKWMWGRRIIKLSCTHVGNAKKFLYSPFTDDSEATAEALAPEPKPRGGKFTRVHHPKKKQAAA